MMADSNKPTVLKGGRIVDPARHIDAVGDLIIIDGRVAATEAGGNESYPGTFETIDCRGAVVAPGLVDMRVFVGEPGFEHRETFASASHAAAAGGITTIVTMPDTEPPIDEPALVDFVHRRARDTAIVNVHPMAALTKGLAGEEMAELGLLREAGAVAFTDGRNTVTNARVMRRILTYAQSVDGLIVHHTEDPDLARAGVMNEGETATRLGLGGVPREAEVIVVERDLRLVALTGGRYHAAQISCADSAAAIAAAKGRGLAVTAGVSINHLTLNENDIGAYRTFFKMSPPLRSEDDRMAMVAALAEGTIDVVVSSHDPQDVETKRHPFAEAADGAIGLETLLPAILRLVHSGDIDLSTAIRALSTRPAEILGIEAGTLRTGARADVVVFAPDTPWILDETKMRSRAKNTPFEGARFQGRVLRTMVAGLTRYTYSDT
ncbi:dihydroorotase [Rhodobium gokarnense]|nr:dihydroorotase [Rhodobium gokarnense]